MSKHAKQLRIDISSNMSRGFYAGEVKAIYECKTSITALPILKSSKDAYNYIKDKYVPESINYFESFYVIFLNRSNRIIAHQQLGQGSITGCILDVRMLISTATIFASVGVVLVHNHPSGSTKPSDADIALTKKVKEGLKLVDIQVLDHLIITDETYFSFTDEGML